MMAANKNLDLDTLRTFVRGVELGSFARAAVAVGRSASAVSGQLRKLEAQVGEALVVRSGRGLTLTPAGEVLLSYARRMLNINDEVLSRIQNSRVAGSVRLGLPPDFSETWLPGVLERFARTHPRVQIEVDADRSTELIQRVGTGQLDLALGWTPIGGAETGEVIASVPVGWIARAGSRFTRDVSQPLPLVVFNEPCVFRRLALAALDAEAIAWRLAFVSPSLPGLWAAVEAQLGVTIRTAIGVPESLGLIDPLSNGLPPLPPVSLSVHRAAGRAEPAVQALFELISATFAENNGHERG